LKHCFEISAKTNVILLESTLEKAFFKLLEQSDVKDRLFINYVQLAKNSLTARILNRINSKLIDVFCQ